MENELGDEIHGSSQVYFPPGRGGYKERVCTESLGISSSRRFETGAAIPVLERWKNKEMSSFVNKG